MYVRLKLKLTDSCLHATLKSTTQHTFCDITLVTYLLAHSIISLSTVHCSKIICLLLTKQTSKIIPQLTLGPCQTRNKVEQLCRSTLLHDKVARLTSQVAQLLTSCATSLLDRNRLYSSAICCSVAEL